MPNALTNTNISATYKGVLHANGEPLPDISIKPVYDGTGVQSALSLGRSNQGASVTGLLSANDVKAGQLRMPNVDGSDNQVVCRSGTDATGSGVLVLKPLSELIGGGPTIADNVYDNPRITVVGGVITKIESRPTIKLLTTPVVLIPYENKSATTFTESFNINWTVSNGYYADAPVDTISPKYAIISVKMYIESNSKNFNTQLLKDSIQIAQATIGANDTNEVERLDRNRYVYISQAIVSIPDTKVSLFEYKSVYESTSTGNKFSTRQNISGRSVTLDGWVY